MEEPTIELGPLSKPISTQLDELGIKYNKNRIKER
jgi:hypothetical protein